MEATEGSIKYILSCGKLPVFIVKYNETAWNPLVRKESANSMDKYPVAIQKNNG